MNSGCSSKRKATTAKAAKKKKLAVHPEVESVANATPSPSIDTVLTAYEISTELNREEWEILMSKNAMLTSDVLDKTLKSVHEAAQYHEDINLIPSCLASACMEEFDVAGLIDSKFMQIFPLCDNRHWQACIFVGLRTEKPAALVLNSMKRYSAMNHGIHHLVEKVGCVCGMPVVYKLEVPQQSNGVDCGFFVHFFIERMMAWCEDLRSGNYTNLAWGSMKDARHDLQQRYRELTSAMLPAAALPVSIPREATPLACAEVVDDLQNFELSLHGIISEIEQKMGLNEVLNPLIDRVQDNCDNFIRSIHGGQHKSTIGRKSRALRAALQNLATQLPPESLYKEQLATFVKVLRSRPPTVYRKAAPSDVDASNARSPNATLLDEITPNASSFDAPPPSATPPDTSRPACVAIIDELEDLMSWHDPVSYESWYDPDISEIQRKMGQIEETNLIFYPLTNGVRDASDQIIEGFHNDQAREPLSMEMQALTEAVKDLTEQLPSEEPENALEVYSAEPANRIDIVANLPAPRVNADKAGRERAKTKMDERKGALFDIKDLEPSTGIGADEEVLLPSGESKRMKDLTVGEYVLDSVGKPVKVLKAPIIVDADAFEVTRDSTSANENLLTRQQVMVGGMHPLEVTLRQHDTRKGFPAPKDRRPSVVQAYTELVATVRHGKWVIVKPRSTSASVTYSATDGMTKEEYAQLTEDEAAKRLEEKKQEAADLLDKKLEKLRIPELRYYPLAHHLVRYNKPSPCTEFYDAINIDTKSRPSITIPTGFVRDSPDMALSPERLKLDELLEGLTEAQQMDALYAAGLWVGNGTTALPHISVHFRDTESMKRCAAIATSLGLYCDVMCRFFEPPEQNISGYEERRQPMIKLSDPSGPCACSEEQIDTMLLLIADFRAKAKEWREMHKGESTPDGKPNVCCHVNVAFFNGYSKGRRRYKEGNLLWDVFQMMRKPSSVRTNIKDVPLWLTTTPLRWREAFLAGMIESGSREPDDSYRCATIHPNVRDGLVAMGRSLGMTVDASLRSNRVDGFSRTLYVVHFRPSDATRRVASLVASPRKKPSGAAPGPDWVRESGRAPFTVTPKGIHELATGFAVEGHRFMLKNFLVVIDNAEELDTQEKVEEYLVEDKCIARGCGQPLTAGHGPSWNILEGRLCGADNKRYIQNSNVYCSKCNYVPLKSEVSGELCPKCQQNGLVRKAADKRKTRIIRRADEN